ncbi:DUF2511 domain-containing protein [Kitasatospora sp. HPMI-4]|uniref:DUF2511 domain-containing protein n=1 Tax=Kitasatospora sp. HPMI-4 TaxID=3448443 RepID=UPI003F1C1FC4
MVELEKPATGVDPVLVRRYGRYFAAGAMAFIVAATAWGCSLGDGSSTHSRTISRSDLSPWPFVVSSGTLRCHAPGAVTFEAGGVEYALNGSAHESYAEPDPIWAADPALGSGLKMSLKPAITAGLALC